MKRFTNLSLAAIAVASLAIDPARTRADEEADLNDLPAAVQKTAHDQIGASSVEEVEPTFAAGQHATEVEYRENGKKMAVVIAKDGTLIQKEYRMSPADAPDVIKAAVTAQYTGATISHIKEVERKDVKFYEVSAKAGGKSHQLKLDETGKPVKVD
jgi:hypothetical protein